MKQLLTDSNLSHYRIISKIGASGMGSIRKRSATATKASLQAEREAERTRYKRENEASLAEDKKRLKNEWLANNPNLTAADFERKAWHLLKANLIRERENAQIEAELAAARSAMDFI
jgi:hypothetical protein